MAGLCLSLVPRGPRGALGRARGRRLIWRLINLREKKKSSRVAERSKDLPLNWLQAMKWFGRVRPPPPPHQRAGIGGEGGGEGWMEELVPN